MYVGRLAVLGNSCRYVGGAINIVISATYGKLSLIGILTRIISEPAWWGRKWIRDIIGETIWVNPIKRRSPQDAIIGAIWISFGISARPARQLRVKAAIAEQINSSVAVIRLARVKIRLRLRARPWGLGSRGPGNTRETSKHEEASNHS